MPRRKSSTKGHIDDFTSPEVSDNREDIPGTGRKPRQLVELARNNYLYLSATGKKPRQLKVQPVGKGKNPSAWRIPLGADVCEGRPACFMRQVTHDELKAEVADAPDSLDSFRPDWATQSFSPRLATPPSPRLLRRRNGRKVVPEYVFGNDNRTFINPTSYPWFCVGRIDVQVNGQFVWYGTGALVGTNVVLTASHIVPWFATQLGFTNRMRFHPGYYAGASIVGSGYYSDVAAVWGYPNHDQGDDMAVLKLYEPLGTGLGYFGYRTYNDDWEDVPRWKLVGYPFSHATGEIPTSQSGIRVIDDDSDGDGLELEHTGDATGGNSGGPLWDWFGNSPRIIGTHSGGELDWGAKNNVAAGGSALSRLIKWGRDNW